jgi:hypothetical protein
VLALGQELELALGLVKVLGLGHELVKKFLYLVLELVLVLVKELELELVQV